MKRLVTVTAMIVAASLLSACAPDLGVQPMSSIDDGAEQSDELLTRFLDAAGPGCSAAVGMEGEVVWSGARGVADLDSGAALTSGSVFDIASVAKQFTATAVLMLESDGALDLDDVVAEYVDGLPKWSRQVSLEELLHHRSGIPDYTALLTESGFTNADSPSQDDALRVIGSMDLTSEPGSRFEYSNSNYVLLAEVVKDVAGIPLPQFLEERVFTPLELEMRVDPMFESADVATPYREDGAKFVAARSGWTQLGDGSLFTTPSQLVRWADVYRTGALFERESLNRALANAPSMGDPSGSRYGPGIQIAADNTLSHLGGWGGYTTVFGISADRSVAIALSCNSSAVDPMPVAEGLRIIWATSATTDS